MNCHYCSTELRPFFSAATVRCDRCGAVHHADGTIISPRMLPIPVAGEWRASPWMFPHTRPIEPGMYDCRFRDAGDLSLYWDGRQFTHGGLRVRCATLLSWRGQWEK